MRKRCSIQQGGKEITVDQSTCSPEKSTVSSCSVFLCTFLFLPSDWHPSATKERSGGTCIWLRGTDGLWMNGGCDEKRSVVCQVYKSPYNIPGLKGKSKPVLNLDEKRRKKNRKKNRTIITSWWKIGQRIRELWKVRYLARFFMKQFFSNNRESVAHITM